MKSNKEQLLSDMNEVAKMYKEIAESLDVARTQAAQLTVFMYAKKLKSESQSVNLNVIDIVTPESIGVVFFDYDLSSNRCKEITNQIDKCNTIVEEIEQQIKAVSAMDI